MSIKKRPIPHTTHILINQALFEIKNLFHDWWLLYTGKYSVIRYLWNSGSKMLQLPKIFLLPRGGTSQVCEDGLVFVSRATGGSVRLPLLREIVKTSSIQNHMWIPYITQIDYLRNQIWIPVKYQSWFSKEDSTKPRVIFQNLGGSSGSCYDQIFVKDWVPVLHCFILNESSNTLWIHIKRATTFKPQ